MASTRRYSWLSGDDVWLIAARFLAESGYANVSTFVDAIRTANPAIILWPDVTAGTSVILPYTTS